MLPLGKLIAQADSAIRQEGYRTACGSERVSMQVTRSRPRVIP
jgi:hypothetical protein